VRHSHGTAGRIHTLPACAPAPVCVDSQVLVADLNVHLNRAVMNEGVSCESIVTRFQQGFVFIFAVEVCWEPKHYPKRVSMGTVYC
jgi:hypothetical protein